MFNLSDKVAVVTGAASGIGEAIAHALAGAGAKVIITDVNAKLGEQVARAINEALQFAYLVDGEVSGVDAGTVLQRRSS